MNHRRNSKRRRAGLLAAAALTLLGAVAALSAQAAEVSREEYVARVEPICKRNTEASERILRGVRKEVKENRLKPAAGKFSRAAAALTATRAQLEAVPRPAADEQRLTKWFTDIGAEIELFNSAAAKLRQGNRAAAERMAVRITAAANRANLDVVPFEFRYCRANPSRFT
jgi:hypothetical protein